MSPLTVFDPVLPTTRARTIRGDLPVCKILIARRRPSKSPPSLEASFESDTVSVQRCTGEALSYGSSTDFR